MIHLINPHIAVGLILLMLATPLGAAGAARTGDAPPAPATPQAGVVGQGNLGSCNESAVHAALAGGGSVTFNCGGPAQILILHEQMITQPTSIDGGGIITLTGGLATRLFNVAANASLQMSRIALDSGATSGAGGGAIVNAGTLRLSQVVIQYSQTDLNHSGGAIFTSGPLFVDDSTFYHNTSSGGGAIYAITANAVLEINNTYFQGNSGLSTSTNAGGGALWITSAASADISGGVFSENHSEANGGAVYNQGTLAANGVIFNANTTTQSPGASFRGYGGAIDNLGDLTLSNTYLANNKSRYGGGLNVGENAARPAAHLDTAYLIDNQAVYAGGGLYASTTTTATAVLTVTDSVIKGNWADVGGGLALNNSAVNIYRSAIGLNHANSAGGLGNSAAPGAGGLVRLYDSTIYSNVITTTEGGAISNQGLMDLRNLTLEGNDSGLFLSGAGEALTMANTVLHNLSLNCDGTGAHPTSLGGNFSGDVSCNLGAVSGDVQGLGLDPLLSPLQFSLTNLNQYFAPLPGSPLINAATFPCSPRDQLGALRHGACDKGAVEFHGLLPAAYLPLARRAP